MVHRRIRSANSVEGSGSPGAPAALALLAPCRTAVLRGFYRRVSVMRCDDSCLRCPVAVAPAPPAPDGGLPPSPVVDTTSGGGAIAVPVSDLDLLAMAPPGATPLTPGPLHGTTPQQPPRPSLAGIAGLDGTVNIRFLCQDTRQQQAGFSWTWYDNSSSGACDHGADTASSPSLTCPVPCRDLNTISAPAPEITVMPRLRMSGPASWTVYAWFSPSAPGPQAGVTAAGSRLNRFSGDGLDFRYPRSWRALVPDYPDTLVRPGSALVFESDEPLTDSCPARTRITGGGGRETSGGFPCGRAPVRVLRPDGALVTWSTSDDTAGSRALSPSGRRERIGGEPAWVFSGPASARTADLGIGAAPGTRHGGTSGPSCRQIGATWVIAATISLGPAPGARRRRPDARMPARPRPRACRDGSPRHAGLFALHVIATETLGWRAVAVTGSGRDSDLEPPFGAISPALASSRSVTP